MQYLVKGKTLPDELSIQCLEVALLDSKPQTRGYVLDGFPTTKQQLRFMTDRGLIPVKIIELTCDVKDMLQRAARDRSTRPIDLILHDSPEILAFKYREWKNEVMPVRQWYMNEHKNWTVINGQLSKWMIWENARTLINASIEKIQMYLSKIRQGKAASIAQLCVTYEEMLNRLREYGQYCPVSLVLYDELVDCSSNKTMDHVAEYQGHYYKMFSQSELEVFLTNPSIFIQPKALKKLPSKELLPKKLTSVEVQTTLLPIELNGYCPVTFYNGKQRYEAIERGNPDFAVEYKGKVYTMLDEDAQEKFMRKPEVYSCLKLPNKLPPVREPSNIFSLPMLGYLEQTCSEVIIKALYSVGTFKPKFPFISPSRSALIYVAYYLKGMVYKKNFD